MVGGAVNVGGFGPVYENEIVEIDQDSGHMGTIGRHRTEGAKVDAPKPRIGAKTGEEIVRYIAGLKTDKNKTMRYMRAVAEAIFDPDDWKAPIYAVLPSCGLEWARAAVMFYHGAEPATSFVGVYSDGYAC